MISSALNPPYDIRELGSRVSELGNEDVTACKNVEHPEPGRPRTSNISPKQPWYQRDILWNQENTNLEAIFRYALE